MGLRAWELLSLQRLFLQSPNPLVLQHQLSPNTGAPSSHPKTPQRTNTFRRCGWAEAEMRHLTSMRATALPLLGGQKEHTTKGRLIANKPDKMIVLAPCPPLMLKAKGDLCWHRSHSLPRMRRTKRMLLLWSTFGCRILKLSCSVHRVATCRINCPLNQKAQRRDVFAQHYWRLSQEWCYSHLGTKSWSPRLLSQFLLCHISGYVSPGSVMEISAPQ